LFIIPATLPVIPSDHGRTQGLHPECLKSFRISLSPLMRLGRFGFQERIDGSRDHGMPRGQHGIIPLNETECVTGMGLMGDRHFGYKPYFKGQVKFFDAKVVDAVRRKFGKPNLTSSGLRRNLIVRGVRLEDWIGKRFRFQGVAFEGSEECKPCHWMDEAVAPDVEAYLKPSCRGGLRARILSDCILRIPGKPFGA
jgi:hypothetical protein